MESYPIIKSYPFKKPGLLDIFNYTSPVAPSGVAMVYIGQSDSFVLNPGNQLPRTVLMQGKFHTIYEVDITKKSYSFEELFDSEVYLDKFLVKVNYSCCVDDPKKIIETDPTNTTDTIKNIIISKINGMARKYNVIDYKDLEDELTGELSNNKFNNVANETGFRVQDFYVTVKLSPEVEERLRKKRVQRENLEDKVVEIDINTKVKSKLFEVLVPLLKHDPELARIYMAKNDDEISDIVKGYKESQDKDIEHKLSLIAKLNRDGISINDVMDIFEIINGKNAKSPNLFVNVEEPKKLSMSDKEESKIKQHLDNAEKNIGEDLENN